MPTEATLPPLASLARDLFLDELRPPRPTPLSFAAGDTMTIVVCNLGGINQAANPWMQRVVLTFVSVAAVLPLALIKDLSKLSKTSLLSLCSVIFITFVVFTRWITGPGDAPVPTTEAERALLFVDVKIFPAIGIISFAFVCHHATFLVFNTLKDNTVGKRWANTVHLSIGVALSVMMVLAVTA